MSDIETIKAKLRQLNLIEAPEVAELAMLGWPAPDGPIYYSGTLDQYLFRGLPVASIEMRLTQRFADITLDSGIADNQLSIEFWDGDQAFSDLALKHGEGVRLELFQWYPQVQLLLSLWWGHLQTTDGAAVDRYPVSAGFGFRSSLLPLPRRAFFAGCQAVFGALFQTQVQINDGDCPYNRHIGGATGLLDGSGNPFTSCPRNRATCIARLGDDLSYLAFDVVTDSNTISETKGPNITVTARSNRNNLKRPLRVIAGKRHVTGLDLLAYVIEPDTKHPEAGSIRTLWTISEGVNKSVTNCKVNNVAVGAQHLNVRLGEVRQPRTGFSAHVPNYSGTSHFYGVSQGDFRTATPDSLQAECDVEGKADVRVYSADEVYTPQYSQDRAWWLLECYRNQRWGLGYDPVRFVIQDFIDLSTWGLETVSFTDADGNHYVGQRTAFNAELIDRTAQQQINDLCLAGRYGLPFPEDGKIRVLPLRKEDLSQAIVFNDDPGPDRNIAVDESGKSTLRWSQISDQQLPNRIVLTFDDEAHNNAEQPLTFEDEVQQFRAGKAFGDTSRRAIEKPYTAFGVTSIGEAGRLGNLLLHLGQFDEGGTKNNLRITFTTWFLFALELRKYKLIKVVSDRLQSKFPFQYFRVMSFRRGPDLKVEVTAQAYPQEYYELLESQTQPPPIIGVGAIDNPGGGLQDRPFGHGFQTLTHTNDQIIAVLQV
jgi:hypothetical protein